MRFIPEGPDIPPELIAAQQAGRVIFVCGAGVSCGAGLPLFEGLVRCVYEKLGEDWELHTAEREAMGPEGKLAGQYDRMLRCLERRLAASNGQHGQLMRARIRSEVRDALTPKEGADLRNHLALLELSRDEAGQNRILTTNFDTLFERAWFEKYNELISSHAGAAMPQPKVADCIGVLHLHGRLEDKKLELQDTALVLTSAEFGDAYLRSGWASRYIYDLVRAHTVVLVGYQAEDPPMRYLLEALEADRERYTDLQKVYAFAPAEPDDEELEHALWVAKAVEPILYRVVGNDHSALYESLRKWSDYANEPKSWRRERLRPILSQAPEHASERTIDDCTQLLQHADACQLLEELSPPAEWLPVLVERHVFEGERPKPGAWIAKQISAPSMIRACADLSSLDEIARWHIHDALQRERLNLTPSIAKAWRLLLENKQTSTLDRLANWHYVEQNIRRGDIDFATRRLIGELLRPRIKLSKAYRLDQGTDKSPKLHELLRISFEPKEYTEPKDILDAWPQDAGEEFALIQILNRALWEALEEANDADALDGFDMPSRDVPSVADHPQNIHQSGFYPITRVLADIWSRLAARDAAVARACVKPWADSPFLLLRRLALFAYDNAVFSSVEAYAAIAGLDDEMFWGGARVEIMRLLVSRWAQFGASERGAIEKRLCEGPPRLIFHVDGSEGEEMWQSIRDSEIFRRLNRIGQAGGELTDESRRVLADVTSRQPNRRHGREDQDDFIVWIESHSGPNGQTGRLDSVDDDSLVREAMRLQREMPFEQGDIWFKFCAADSDRALAGLKKDADNARWDAEAWSSFLWAVIASDDAELRLNVGATIARMPDAALRAILPAATAWLSRQWRALWNSDVCYASFLNVWDRFAAQAFAPRENVAYAEAETDLTTEALNTPGGMLAGMLLEVLASLRFQPGQGLGPELKPRFDRLADATGRSGLLARVRLTDSLASLECFDPAWIEAKMQPRLIWGHPEALPLWHSFAHCRVGPARLFNALKDQMLEAFTNQRLSDNEIGSLVKNLLCVAAGRQRGEAPHYELTTMEIKRALTIGPPAARRHASLLFWRMLADEGAEVGHQVRWRTLVGPLFKEIWPADAELRCESTTQNFVLMALDSDEAFPEVVEAIWPVLVPYRLCGISYTLRLVPKHNELLTRYPLAFLALANALIDPSSYPAPNDLGTLLQDALAADPKVERAPAYQRLNRIRILTNS